MTCPDCKGSGVTVADHVRYADGSGAWNVPGRCYQCDGSGTITDEQARWIGEGQRMREDRVAHGVGLRLEAAHRGMSVIDLSHMEQGKIQPVPANPAPKGE